MERNFNGRSAAGLIIAIFLVAAFLVSGCGVGGDNPGNSSGQSGAYSLAVKWPVAGDKVLCGGKTAGVAGSIGSAGLAKAAGAKAFVSLRVYFSCGLLYKSYAYLRYSRHRSS